MNFPNEVLSSTSSYLNYQFIETTSDSRYYSLMPWHHKPVVDILISELQNINFNLWIDATSHIGVDAFLIRKLYPCLDIIAIEKNKETFKVLENNVTNLSMILNKPNVKPIITINQDCVQYLRNFNSLEGVVIYFDPPWGGSSYKKSDYINLFLNDEMIGDIILDLLNLTPALIILKVPSNFNFNLFNNQILYSYRTYPIYTPSLKNPKISYYLLFI